MKDSNIIKIVLALKTIILTQYNEFIAIIFYIIFEILYKFYIIVLGKGISCEKIRRLQSYFHKKKNHT